MGQERTAKTAWAEPHRSRAGRNGRRRRVPARADAQEAGTVALPKAPPAQPGVVVRVKTPGEAPRDVVMPAPPGAVPVSGSVDDRTVVGITAQVSRQVAHVNDVRRGIVDVDIAHVVHGAVGRNVFNSKRPGIADAPRPLGVVGDVPDSLIARVVAAIGEDHLRVGVHGILEIRALDPLELRLAVVGRLEAAVAPLDRARLRYFRIGDRVLRLIGARDARQDVSLGRIRRHAPEALGQLVPSDEGPGPIRRLGAEPAPGDQHVEGLGFDLEHHVAFRVGHVEERVACERRISRRPVRGDELRGLGGGQHFRGRPRDLIGGRGVGREDLANRGGRILDVAPGSQGIVCPVPEVGAVQVVGALPRIEDHGVGSVRGALEGRSFDRLEHRRAIVDHEDRAPGVEEDLGRCVVETGDARPLLLGRRQTSLQLLHGARQIPSRGLGLHQLLITVRFIRCDSRQPHLGDVEVACGHDAAVAIDLDVFRVPQDSVHRVLVLALLQRERGPSREHVAVQMLGLRLVNHEGAARRIELARPTGIVGASGHGSRKTRGHAEHGEESRDAGRDRRMDPPRRRHECLPEEMECGASPSGLH